MQSCEGSVPTTAIYLKAKHQEPTKCFQSSAKPKIHSLERSVPSTGKDTYQIKKASLCLSWEWLSHWALSKISMGAGGGGYTAATNDLNISVAYKKGWLLAGGIYYRYTAFSLFDFIPETRMMKQALSSFFWLSWQREKKWWTSHWLLKFMLRSNMYDFCSFSPAKASHMAKSDVNGSGKYNPSLGRSFKYLGTIIQLTTTTSYITTY